MSRMCVMVLALSLKPLATHFEKYVGNESSVKKVVETYDSMRFMVEHAKSWTNWLVLFHCIGILTFFAYIPALKASIKGAENGYLVYTYVMYGAFLIFACEMTNRAS